VTGPSRSPAGQRHRQASPPLNASPKTADKDQPEIGDPYDLPFPEDQRPPGRPAYLIVVDQLRGWRPDQPRSLAELLETQPGRTRQPEPDLEAEP
jgi:hypothetical protein